MPSSRMPVSLKRPSSEAEHLLPHPEAVREPAAPVGLRDIEEARAPEVEEDGALLPGSCLRRGGVSGTTQRPAGGIHDKKSTPHPTSVCPYSSCLSS